MTTWILDIEAVSPYFTAWMLTYLVHSSVILGLACLLWRLLPDSALPTKELLLKVGLVGGLLTASLQIGLGLTPLAGVWELRPGRDSLGTAAASFLPTRDVEASQASLSQRRAASSPSSGSIASSPESPPPTTDRASDSAIASATASVPLAKASISNTPMGPFQKMVRARLASAA